MRFWRKPSSVDGRVGVFEYENYVAGGILGPRYGLALPHYRVFLQESWDFNPYVYLKPEAENALVVFPDNIELGTGGNSALQREAFKAAGVRPGDRNYMGLKIAFDQINAAHRQNLCGVSCTVVSEESFIQLADLSYQIFKKIQKGQGTIEERAFWEKKLHFVQRSSSAPAGSIIKVFKAVAKRMPDRREERPLAVVDPAAVEAKAREIAAQSQLAAAL